MTTTARQIQFAHLRALAAVAATGSLTKAAADLGYTEPAVHLQLAALRRAVGGPVVIRVGGRMELTELGQLILSYAEQALDTVEQLAMEADQARANDQRVLRIGLGRGTGIYLFPRIAALVAERHPDTKLELTVLPGEEMVKALDSNRIDIGITTNLNQMLVRTGHSPGVEFTAVRCVRYEWAFLASPDFARAVDRGEVSSLLILLPEWAGTRLDSVRAMVRPLELEVQVESAAHTEAAKSAALASQAVALVPHYTARHELMSGELVTCLDDLPLYESYLYLGHRRPARHPDIANFVLFIREIRGLMRQLVTVDQAPNLVRAARLVPAAQ